MYFSNLIVATLLVGLLSGCVANDTTSSSAIFSVSSRPSSSSNAAPPSSMAASSSAPAVLPVANNLISNGDLESGLNPWEPRGGSMVDRSTVAKRSGNYSVITTNRTLSWHGVAYPLDYLTPGNIYQFKAWVRLIDGAQPANIKLSIEYKDSVGSNYPNFASAVATSNDWTLLEGNYTHSPSGGVSGLKVYVESDNESVSFYVDDLSMTGSIDPIPEPVSGDITIDTNSSYQVIDGFGAALPMWTGATWSDSEVQKLVGLGDDQLGLSIVRTIIRPNQSDWPLHVNALKAARQYGSEMKVLASPWTPPASWKTNNSEIDGGKLLGNRYGDYANHLNEFVAFMSGKGVAIDVTSIQNEPNWHPSYESCDWTGDELKNFVRDHGSKIKNTQLMVAETIGFQRNYTDPTLNDTNAANAIGYIGGHLYGPWNVDTHQPTSALSAYPLAAQKGKPVWMTEWNYHRADNINGSEPTSGSTSPWADQSNQKVWDETIDDVMSSIHFSMTSNWSAYIWWWGKRYYSFIGENRGEAYLNTTTGEVLKRGWAFSQYAKFIRPGYVRVAASKGGSVANRNNLFVTAYHGDDQKLVLVIINRESADLTNVTIGLPVVPKSADYTFTSRYSARKDSDISLNGQKATITIPARSISTVVIGY